ncbi:MAG: transmembrane Mn(2+) transporter [Planctomycetota bacterium]|nr:MAG: transmembrane Mn(2+) transporter [Planctomycetota bacterium]
MSDTQDHDTLPPSLDPQPATGVLAPPSTLVGILRRLGPGLIIAGSIVGSGELIATTKTGAQAGITLLWLIIIGCVIKVFVQIELGRYTITHGETTLAALDQVPGPRLKVNWIIWFWLLMMVIGFGQLGGIVGGVGQAAAIAIPIRGDYRAAVEVPSQDEIERYVRWQDDLEGDRSELAALSAERQETILRGQQLLGERLEALEPEHGDLAERVRSGESLVDPVTWDDKVWATVAAVLTMGLLYRGRYRMIQNVSMVLVVVFTFITIGNVISLQTTDTWHISREAFLSGLMFRFPDAAEGVNPVATALAAFGIIGVGASELFAYPYWCLEKGYARFTGKRSDDASWAERARGWLRVMHYDAFCSMVVYTVATLAFFLMGVAVLYNEGLDPDGMRMVSTLSRAYVPVFGEYARWLFLIGAVAVLYSTFLVSTAGNARMWTDCCKLFGAVSPHDQRQHDLTVTAFSVGMPVVCLVIFTTGINPVRAILLAGAMQALLLPMLGVGALYFRYTRTDPRLKPSIWWDVALVVSFLGLLVAGVWGAWPDFIRPLLQLAGIVSTAAA